MIDNYIKVHVTHCYATVDSVLHPPPLCELTRKRIASVREELATQDARSHYHDGDNQSITSWVFTFSSEDEASIEQARIAAHEQATELAQSGLHPRLTLFRRIKSLSMPLIGELPKATEAA